MTKRTLRIANYLRDLATAADGQARMALARYLSEVYAAERAVRLTEDEVAYLAAGVTNRVFGEPPVNDFQRDQRELISKRSRELSTNDHICELVTKAAYIGCYARYVMSGGSIGVFSNHYLQYIRGLSFASYDLVQKAQVRIRVLGPAILAPLEAMVELGIFRPLPKNPNEKNFYAEIHEFAIASGVAFNPRY
jgi:hypothetical protein